MLYTTKLDQILVMNVHLLNLVKWFYSLKFDVKFILIKMTCEN